MDSLDIEVHGKKPANILAIGKGFLPLNAHPTVLIEDLHKRTIYLDTSEKQKLFTGGYEQFLAAVYHATSACNEKGE